NQEPIDMARTRRQIDSRAAPCRRCAPLADLALSTAGPGDGPPPVAELFSRGLGLARLGGPRAPLVSGSPSGQTALHLPARLGGGPRVLRPGPAVDARGRPMDVRGLAGTGDLHFALHSHGNLAAAPSGPGHGDAAGNHTAAGVDGPGVPPGLPDQRL